MATSSAVDTNIKTLPAADQARTNISTSGTTTTVTVTGPALSNLVVETGSQSPKLTLNGSFNECSFIGGAKTPETFTVTGGTALRNAIGGGNKVTASTFVLGSDSFKDTVDFQKGASAKKVVIADFEKGDKLKYKGKTYTYADVSGNKFDGLSAKQIKLA